MGRSQEVRPAIVSSSSFPEGKHRLLAAASGGSVALVDLRIDDKRPILLSVAGWDNTLCWTHRLSPNRSTHYFININN